MQADTHADGVTISRQLLTVLVLAAMVLGGFSMMVGAAEPAQPEHVIVHLTRSWDYAVVRVTVNGEPGIEAVDLFNTEARAVTTTTLDLGVHGPVDGGYVVRFEVVGSNDKAEKPGTYFGIDCFELERGD